MTALSQNHWPVITSAASLSLRDWVIGPVTLSLRNGPAGFILAHQAQWFHESVERLWLHDMPDFDDHGWGQRNIGSTNVPSNHWSATAMDLNARRHPQGTEPEETFTDGQVRQIRRRCMDKYEGALKWGGDFRTTPDPMHYELEDRLRFPPEKLKTIALGLIDTTVGRRLIEAQPKPFSTNSW